ncbi:MAG: hypothetical protein GQ574_10950 [Crocinitomix sp.]|nr:hypothetical protein [Crocinitomix sp.]
MRISLLYTFLFVLISFPSMSQRSPLQYSIGLRNHNLQDLGHSPVLYTGSGLYLGITNKNFHKNNFSGFELNYSFSMLAPKQLSINPLTTNDFKHKEFGFNWTYLRHILKKNEKLVINFGGLLNLEADYSIYNTIGNNPIAYDASLSINPAIRFNYRFKFIYLMLDVDVPILSYTLRPKAKGFFPTENGDITLSAILQNGKVQTLNNYFYIHTNFGMIFNRIKNLQVFYDFKGGVNKSSEHRGFMQHTIGLKFNFNKNSKSILDKCPID